MRKRESETVRELTHSRENEGKPLKRMPERAPRTTRQMHERLLRALRDSRIKRALG